MENELENYERPIAFEKPCLVCKKQFESKLLEHYIFFETQFQLEGKIFDFFLPEKNLLVEIDGIFWHSRDYKEGKLSFESLYPVQKKIFTNDKLKASLAEENGFSLIRIWETDIETFDIVSIV